MGSTVKCFSPKRRQEHSNIVTSPKTTISPIRPNSLVVTPTNYDPYENGKKKSS